MKAKKLFLAAATLIAISLTLSCAGSKPTAHTPGAYVETEGGFAVVPPDGWQMFQDPELRYKIFASQTKDDSASSVTFMIEESGHDLNGYVESSIISSLTEINAKTTLKQDFKTAKGLKGKKIIATKEADGKKYRISIYVIPNEKSTYMTAEFISHDKYGSKYDAMFDKSMKTFEWIERTAQAENQTGTYIAQIGEHPIFKIESPYAWLIIQQRNQEFKTLISPNEADYGANINFAVRKYDQGISEYLDANIAEFQTVFSQNNFQVIGKEDFATAKGIKGKKATATLEANGNLLKLFLYVIPHEKGIYLFANGTALSSLSDKFEPLFDESMRTFEWME